MLTSVGLDLKSRNKDCCDDHVDFCGELYGAEENVICKLPKEPEYTTIYTGTSTFNTATTTATTYFTTGGLSWLFVRIQD